MKHNLSLLLLLAMLLLSGCSLAVEDESPGRLIGVLVTTDHLNRAQEDSALSASGSTPDDAFSPFRLYAEAVTVPLRSDSGEISETIEFQFPCGGFLLCAPWIEDGDNSYHAVNSGGLFDTNAHFTSTDGGTSIELSATAAAVPDAGDVYLNPVYQQENGQIYATPGSTYRFGEGNLSEGELYSKTWEESASSNGEEVRSTVTVSLEVRFPPESVTVLQFDEGGTPLARDEFAPDALPEQLKAEPETAYLIVETAKRSPEEATVLTREILGRGAEGIESYTVDSSGLCRAAYIHLDFSE